jgi:hypothetical protein
MKVKSILLGLIIGVVLLMFLVFGSKLIYENPRYENYCDYSKINITENPGAYNECSLKYDYANENYSQKMFIFSLIIGVLIIIGSAVFIEISSVSGGLMLGSLMFIIYGTGSYWRYMDDWTRFIILGLALFALIYIGYWLNNKENKKGVKNGKRKTFRRNKRRN